MSRFTKYAWSVVAYTILVILWGAVVRATGSGAGCGNHWPDCNGQVIPRPEEIETLIEFSHRLTSAFAGVLVIILLIWAFRLKPVQRFVRRMAILSFVFILIEGALGAALVRLELVGDNASTARAVMIGLHLMNTLVLLAWLSLTAWGAQRNMDRVRFDASGWMGAGVLIALFAYMVMSATGAVTALGDTLFLSGALERQGLDPAEHFLVQLRVIHPMLAIVVSMYLIGLAYRMQRSGDKRVDKLAVWLYVGVFAQVFIGVVNVLLQAPVWMQLLHLLAADALWLLLMIMSAEVLLAPADKRKVSLAVDAGNPLPAGASGD
jgi:heme A synthase